MNDLVRRIAGDGRSAPRTLAVFFAAADGKEFDTRDDAARPEYIDDDEPIIAHFCLSSPEWCQANPIRGREFQKGAHRP